MLLLLPYPYGITSYSTEIQQTCCLAAAAGVGFLFAFVYVWWGGGILCLLC